MLNMSVAALKRFTHVEKSYSVDSTANATLVRKGNVEGALELAAKEISHISRDPPAAMSLSSHSMDSFLKKTGNNSSIFCIVESGSGIIALHTFQKKTSDCSWNKYGSKNDVGFSALNRCFRFILSESVTSTFVKTKRISLSSNLKNISYFFFCDGDHVLSCFISPVSAADFTSLNFSCTCAVISVFIVAANALTILVVSAKATLAIAWTFSSSVRNRATSAVLVSRTLLIMSMSAVAPAPVTAAARFKSAISLVAAVFFACVFLRSARNRSISSFNALLLTFSLFNSS